MYAAVLVTLGVDAELIVVAGQNGVEQDTGNGGNGQGGQGDGGAGHGEGQTAGEAQAADQNDSGNEGCGNW